MDSPRIKINLNNNPSVSYKLSNIILPLKKKKQIFDNMLHFKEEYNLFLSKLRQADEVYLVGKNFKFSDKDIAEDIKEICLNSKGKHVIYIDPKNKCLEWLKYHNSIFNVASYEAYENLPDYIDKKNL